MRKVFTVEDFDTNTPAKAIDRADRWLASAGCLAMREGTVAPPEITRDFNDALALAQDLALLHGRGLKDPSDELYVPLAKLSGRIAVAQGKIELDAPTRNEDAVEYYLEELLS